MPLVAAMPMQKEPVKALALVLTAFAGLKRNDHQVLCMEPPIATGATSSVVAVRRGGLWFRAGVLFAAHQPVRPVSVEWTPVAGRSQTLHRLVVRLEIDPVRCPKAPFARFKPPVLPRHPSPMFVGVPPPRPTLEREVQQLMIEGSL